MTRSATHDFDAWFWCRACGLGVLEVHNEGGIECVPPLPGVLAMKRLEQIERRRVLVCVAEQVMEDLA